MVEVAMIMLGCLCLIGGGVTCLTELDDGTGGGLGVIAVLVGLALVLLAGTR